jgi:hypothetical protein
MEKALYYVFWLLLGEKAHNELFLSLSLPLFIRRHVAWLSCIGYHGIKLNHPASFPSLSYMNNGQSSYYLLSLNSLTFLSAICIKINLQNNSSSSSS